MQDWEVLAMNERSLRENLAEKDAELREQLEAMKDEYEKAARDRDTNNQAVEGLQKALQEVQNRKWISLHLRVFANLIRYSSESRTQEVRRDIRVTNQRSTKTGPSRRASIERRQRDTRGHAKRAGTCITV
jgi:hypothetical protein